jgi:2-keto-4-pentenoate hydratase
MPPAQLQSVVEALVRSRARQHPVDAARFAHAVGSPALAYDVQQGVADRLAWFGHEAPRYWKSGGPSREAVLTHAPLPPDGIWPSPATSSWPFAMRGIEAEIALRLAVDVDAQCASTINRDSACQLIDAMTVSIEIVDSRWLQGLAAPALLKLADLQSHGALVLGQWVAFDGARNWSDQVCRVQISGAPVHEFCGTHSMDDPAFVLPTWLRHATRGGRVLPAGSVVSTGTWCGILHAQPGDSVLASFDGIGEARVAFAA